MPKSTSNYKVFLETQLNLEKSQAQLTAFEKQRKINLKVSIDSEGLKRVEQELNRIGKEGGIVGKVTTFEDSIGQIASAQITYKNALGETVKYTTQITEDVVAQYQRTTDLAKIQRDINKTETQRNAIEKKNADEMARYYNAAEKFLQRMERYPKTASVNRASGTAFEIKTAVDRGELDKARELNNLLKIQASAVSKVREGLAGWADHIKHAMVQTISYSTSLGLLYSALNKITEGLEYIRELNKEMINIQVLQQEGLQTKEQVKDLALEYNQLAKELGVTTLEVMRGGLEWSRQGKTIEETKELLKSTVMLSKLGAMDSATATQMLTSTLNGFKLEAKDAARVVDDLVNVDNIAATSSGKNYAATFSNEWVVTFN